MEFDIPFPVRFSFLLSVTIVFSLFSYCTFRHLMKKRVDIKYDDYSEVSDKNVTTYINYENHTKFADKNSTDTNYDDYSKFTDKNSTDTNY